MSPVNAVLDRLLTVPPAVAFTVIALLVLGEAALFVGFVLPGETAVVLGGVLASQGRLSLPALLVLVPLAAIVGDSIGYEVGHRLGPRMLERRLLQRHAHRIDRARGFLRRRGGPAVFLGRWTAFLRAVMPALAGLSRVPYRVFLLFNAIGGIIWGITFCLVGYLAGASYHRVERLIGTAGALLTLGVALAGLGYWHLRRRRAERALQAPGGRLAQPDQPDQAAAPSRNA
jgi:membrane-associated protein